MNRQQYLLLKLAEEASEVAQMALKTAQFGFDEKLAGQPYSNQERLEQEVVDLFAILHMLQEEFGFWDGVNDTLEERVKAKVEKVNKYHGYSVSLGLVSE